jgi:hypothetical protein
MNDRDKKELEDIYVSILEENRQLLVEMFIIGDDAPKYNFIAYKDKVWRLNERPGFSSQNVKDNILNTFGYKVETSDPFPYLIVMISNKFKSNEMLFGTFDNGVVEILDEYYSMIKSPRNSVLFKKTIEALGATKISFSSDNLKSIDKTRFPKRFDTDEIFYHGTSSVFLDKILSGGLDRNTLNSKWPDSVKSKIKGKTFISSNFGYAWNHAGVAVNGRGGHPIVISFRIRFEDLLQPDYDVEVLEPTPLKALNISREMGIYGYKGSIMPYDFDELYYSLVAKSRADDYSGDDIKKIDARLARDLIVNKRLTLEELDEYNS